MAHLVAWLARSWFLHITSTSVPFQVSANAREENSVNNPATRFIENVVRQPHRPTDRPPGLSPPAFSRPLVACQLIVVGLDALAAADLPPDAVTVLGTSDGAFAATFTVTVMVG